VDPRAISSKLVDKATVDRAAQELEEALHSGVRPAIHLPEDDVKRISSDGMQVLLHLVATPRDEDRVIDAVRRRLDKLGFSNVPISIVRLGHVERAAQALEEAIGEGGIRPAIHLPEDDLKAISSDGDSVVLRLVAKPRDSKARIIDVMKDKLEKLGFGDVPIKLAQLSSTDRAAQALDEDIHGGGIIRGFSLGDDIKTVSTEGDSIGLLLVSRPHFSDDEILRRVTQRLAELGFPDARATITGRAEEVSSLRW
jgi:hypothetical protein